MANDRTSKVAIAELYPYAKRVVAAAFLRRVLDKLPYKVHTVLTDNGVPFTPQAHQFLPGGHSFDGICRSYGVEHRLTKTAHPWTNGQVERMNRTINEPTTQRYHYQTKDELHEPLQTFWPITTPNGSRPYGDSLPMNLSVPIWQKNSVNFNQDPTHLTLGLYILVQAQPRFV